MPDDPARPEPPRLDYAPEADPGGIYIARHDGGLTVIVPPVPVGQGTLLGGVAACLLLGLAAWHVTPGGWATADWGLRLILLGITCVIGLVIVPYGYHLSIRHVRIDVDERQLRRTARGLFGRREQAWDRQRIKGLHRTDEEPAGDDSMNKYLMVGTDDGRQYVLLDSPDPAELTAVEDALREALELPVDEPPS